MKITVDAGSNRSVLPHFWRSIGFSPASLLLNSDMQQQLAYARSTGGITYARVHYLLDLVQGHSFESHAPVYDWSVLDRALDVLLENRLHPFFELMGNPAGYFTDFTNDGHLHAWRRLIRAMVLHYEARYGPETVRNWYFETWNEPDAWWSQNIEGFLNYYDACSEGLREADPQLRFGGPGTSETLSPFFKACLEHCDTGINYFTGETGVRLDFISVHEKGAPPTSEDITPNTRRICDAELEAVAYINAHHPRFSALPFMNNECDPQVGWWHHHSWRGQPYYAAIICRIINQHLQHLHDQGVNYALLSSDNGFMGAWGNRTLTTRFSTYEDSSGQADHKTTAKDLQEDPQRRAFELIKKPVLNVFALLNRLGDKRCNVEGVGDADASIGVLATRQDNLQVMVLVYHSKDRFYADGQQTIELHLENLPFSEMAMAHYRIDETHNNPFDQWVAHGANRYPWTKDAVYPAMRAHQEVPLLEPIQHITGHNVTFEFDLPLPAVSLLVLSARREQPPDPVSHVRLTHYQGLIAPATMIAWESPANWRFIHTYEVQYSRTRDGIYERVNAQDTFCTAYLHTDSPRTGWYRVRAVDYWQRYVDSEPVAIGD